MTEEHRNLLEPSPMKDTIFYRRKSRVLTRGKICTALFLSMNPAIMVFLAWYSGGWTGALTCLAMFALLWFVITGIDSA